MAIRGKPYEVWIWLGSKAICKRFFRKFDREFRTASFAKSLASVWRIFYFNFEKFRLPQDSSLDGFGAEPKLKTVDKKTECKLGPLSLG